MKSLFRRILIAILFVINSYHITFSQTKKENTSWSPYVYIYRLSSTEVEHIFNQKKPELDSSYFHTLVDSIPEHLYDETYLPVNLTPGYYAGVIAEKNYIYKNLFVFSNLRVKSISDGRTFSFMLYDITTEKEITDAKIKLGEKNILYDKNYGCYKVNKNSGRDVLRIEAKGEIIFYTVEKKYNYKDRGYKKKYEGYLAFNKPKYLPGDTVKFKAHITKKGKPLNKEIVLIISKERGYWRKKNTLLSTKIKPVSKGSYIYQFPLGDTLKLDQKYSVTFIKKKKKRYWNDKELVSGDFYLEEYQLDETVYAIRSEKAIYQKGENINLYVKGTDHNGLPVYDGKVKLKVIPNTINDIQRSEIQLPYEIYSCEKNLEPGGETKITIPADSIPVAGVIYKASAAFSNSNNELQKSSAFFEIKEDFNAITFSEKEDSVLVQYYENGKEVSAKGIYWSVTDNDTTIRKYVLLPYIFKPNLYSEKYFFRIAKEEAMYQVPASGISFENYRTADSIVIMLVNPGNTEIYYYLYKNGNLISQGFSNQFSYSARDISNADYSLKYRYLSQGQYITREVHVPAPRNTLDVVISQPEKTYPGQKVQVKIKVQDFNSTAVENADITASAINSQFKKTNLPKVPNFNKEITLKRKEIKLYKISLQEKNIKSSAVNDFWRKEMKLDKIHYYRLINPGAKIYKYYIPISSPSAQFSPYVIEKGRMLHVFMIYVDDTLVYYNNAWSEELYSCVAKPGKHTIRVRTLEEEYIVNDIELRQGYKLEFSFDGKKLPSDIKKEKKKRKLSKIEKEIIKNNVFAVNEIPYYGNYGWYLWTNPEDVKRLTWIDNKFVFQNGDTIYLMSGDNNYKKIPFIAGRRYNFNKNDSVYHDSIRYWPRKFYRINYTDYNVAGTTKSMTSIKEEGDYSPTENKFPYYNQRDTEKGKGTFACIYTGREIIHSLLLFNADHQLGERKYNNAILMHNIPLGVYKGVAFTGRNNSHYFPDDSIVIEAGKICLKKYTLDSLLPINTLKQRMPEAQRILNERLLKDRKKYIGSAYGEIHLSNDFKKNQLTVKKNPILEENPIYYVNDELIYPWGKRYFLKGKKYSHKRHRTRSKFGGEGAWSSGKAGHLYRIAQVSNYDKKAKSNLAYGNANVSYMMAENSMAKAEEEKEVAFAFRMQEDERELYQSGYFDSEKLNKTVAADTNSTLENAMLQGSSIREKFKDDAYWQPVLFTDEKGEVTFDVTFPDNITKWNSFAIAMANSKSGTGFAETKTYKPVMAILSMPRFLVEGDTTFIIGKALNYTNDKLSITTSFKINNKLYESNKTLLENSFIEKSILSTTGTDSLSIEYSLKLDSLNYNDGELEKLPVFPIGLEEAKGEFFILEKDTSFTLSLDTLNANYEISVLNNDLDILLDKITKLRTYRYECNEQLASKLIALLSEKKIKENMGEYFKWEGQIRRIISKLEKTQNSNGSWGWWEDSPPNYFMTVYVAQAFIKAREQGYLSGALSKAARHIRFHLNEGNKNDQVLALYVLLKDKSFSGVQEYISRIDPKDLTTYYRYLLIHVKQIAKMDYSIDEILKDKKETILGSCYWGDDSLNWYNNTTQLSLIAYKILETEGKHDLVLRSIRKYFMEHSSTNTFRNTYESASIMETILPALLKENKNLSRENASVTLNGQTVTRFPYKGKINSGNSKLHISSKGKGSMYISLYRREWNKNPQPKEDVFVVKTSFLSDGKPTTDLKAGEVTTMAAEITVKKKSDFVMIEIPIPAGCSYNNKNQSYLNYEVHREYFKDKVAVFCEKLPPGKYQFSIELQPRFNGSYTLNPANIELMYFPVFNGRNELKRIKIIAD